MLPENKAANLKTVAERVGLAPCSVSAILNNTEAARAIPKATKERVYRAANELNYRPNLWARSLRTKRTRMVAVIAPGFAHSSVAGIVEAAQRQFHREGYMLVLIVAGFQDGFCTELHQRGIEGIIAIGPEMPTELSLPVTAVNVGSLALDSSAHEFQPWIAELGRSAAQALIGQIEHPASSRRLTLERKTPPTFFDAQAASHRFPSTAEPA